MKEGGWGGMRGDGVEWSEGGRGSGTTHLGTSLPVSIHVRSPLFMSCGGRFGWWWFEHVVVRGSWVMVKGAHRRPVVARPVVAVACLLPRVVVLLISKGGRNMGWWGTYLVS